MTSSLFASKLRGSRRTLLTRSTAFAAFAAVAPGRLTRALAQDATPATATLAPAASAPIRIASGPVSGLEHEGVIAYKGIPYAAPPLSDLRWASPQPVVPWTEPLAADNFCRDCMQVIVRVDSIQTSPSEDCLCLNIWKPAEMIADVLLPVMVWIHGGGYVGGGSSASIYDGAAFARQDMVVVSFNYRLGRFGFFAQSAILDNTEGPYGNYGYLDQIAALRWVHENISDFGGDPHRVTLVGESAGGASIIHLMTSPAVEDGLFQQVVILSGGGREALLDRPMNGSLTDFSAENVDNLFAASIGVVGNGQEALDELRAKPAEELVDDLDLEKLARRRLLGATLAGVPAVDGEVVEGQPQDHFLDGTAKLMPVIIGSTAIDVPTHFPPDTIRPLKWFGPDAEAARVAYGFGHDRFLGPADLIDLLLSIGVDMTMHEPAHFIAGAMQNAGCPSWIYRFTYTAESTRPEQVAQVHTGELPFLFDTLSSRYGAAVTENDRAVATAFHTYVANFIKHGDPNEDGLPAWPAVTPDEFDVMNFTLEDGPVYGPDPRSTVALVSAARERHRGDDVA